MECLEILQKYNTGHTDPNAQVSYVFLNGDILGETIATVDVVREIRTRASFPDETHQSASVFVAPTGHVYIYIDEGQSGSPCWCIKEFPVSECYVH